jgi:hypothetical protein
MLTNHASTPNKVVHLGVPPKTRIEETQTLVESEYRPDCSRICKIPGAARQQSPHPLRKRSSEATVAMNKEKKKKQKIKKKKKKKRKS